MSRKQLRRRKVAVLVLLMAFLAAISAMLVQPDTGEAQRISDTASILKLQG